MVNHKIDGVKSAFSFLRDCICASHEWNIDDIEMEVSVRNVKTGETDRLSYEKP